MASFLFSCFNQFNLKNKIMKLEHKKIFHGPSKILKSISWPINICLKYFMTPTKTLRPPPYMLNVRSLISLKNSCGGKFTNKIPWSELLMILDHKAAFTPSLSSAQKTFIFSEISPIHPYFFHLKSLLWKDPVTVKIRRKKIIYHILGYISFYFKVSAHSGHLFG